METSLLFCGFRPGCKGPWGGVERERDTRLEELTIFKKNTSLSHKVNMFRVFSCIRALQKLQLVLVSSAIDRGAHGGHGDVSVISGVLDAHE